MFHIGAFLGCVSLIGVLAFALWRIVIEEDERRHVLQLSRQLRSEPIGSERERHQSEADNEPGEERQNKEGVEVKCE
jgi:hypothetical protein